MIAICLFLFRSRYDVVDLWIFADVHIAPSLLTSDTMQWDNNITNIKGVVFPASLKKLHLVSLYDQFVVFLFYLDAYVAHVFDVSSLCS